MKMETPVPADIKEWERIIHSPIRWPENPSSKLDFLDLEIPGKSLSEIISEDRGDRSIS
ncbi:MAG: hypothetical protein M0041_00425 [Nitrospiraceae bacterium]|nr:hypothetical protein [Nitrospiraceae bacterium]